MAVIKLGGVNGSGKTSVARALIELTGAEPVDAKPTAYVGTLNHQTWAIIGSYRNVCGGMDTISCKFKRLELVRQYAEDKEIDHVLFEGLITGKTYGAFGEMSEEPHHMGNWLYTFMDTPFEVAVQRVLQRRKEKGNDKPFDPERTMRPTHKSVHRVAERAAEYGHPVLWLPHHMRPKVLARRVIKAAKEL